MTLTVSLNEIRAEVEKAIQGVKRSPGQAKDGGVMAAWLAEHNIPFLGALNRCLEDADQKPPDQKPTRQNNAQKSLIKADCIAPFDGLILAEYCCAMREAWSGAVYMPRFLAAAIGIVAAEQKIALTLKVGGAIRAAAAPNNEDTQFWLHAEGIPSALCHVEIIPQKSIDETAISAGLIRHPPSQHHSSQHLSGYQLPRQCWQVLSRYAHRTYVAETEEKRLSGAGASAGAGDSD